MTSYGDVTCQLLFSCRANNANITEQVIRTVEPVAPSPETHPAHHDGHMLPDGHEAGFVMLNLN